MPAQQTLFAIGTAYPIGLYFLKWEVADIAGATISTGCSIQMTKHNHKWQQPAQVFDLQVRVVQDLEFNWSLGYPAFMLMPLLLHMRHTFQDAFSDYSGMRRTKTLSCRVLKQLGISRRVTEVACVNATDTLKRANKKYHKYLTLNIEWMAKASCLRSVFDE